VASAGDHAVGVDVLEWDHPVMLAMNGKRGRVAAAGLKAPAENGAGGPLELPVYQIVAIADEKKRRRGEPRSSGQIPRSFQRQPRQDPQDAPMGASQRAGRGAADQAHDDHAQRNPQQAINHVCSIGAAGQIAPADDPLSQTHRLNDFTDAKILDPRSLRKNAVEPPEFLIVVGGPPN